MPHANQYLLLYVLDLLSVFARKSDKNLMTAQSKQSFLIVGFPMFLLTRGAPRVYRSCGDLPSGANVAPHT
jgi:hypothetical protein